MVCTRCGNTIADNTIVCPACGAVNPQPQTHAEPSTSYGQYAPGSQEEHISSGASSISPQAGRATPHQAGYSSPHASHPGYAPAYNAAPLYRQATFAQGFTVSNKNDTALIAEIILSLFGIFGVGWLMARETTVGIILLVCSFLIYWPLMLLGTVFTLGIGLVCLGPLAIGAIILNILLLNSVLKRKAASFILVPPSQQQMPPQYHP
ncbi:zinc ribbon domain-containing protein [Ktedonosporobacter rubrisoli]|uniref:Zinc ribbon domain-containing protein n=1 Tax=Ktedonosporobacter rubrisoli TaxID=2509675 RepID=A0A4P6JU93_KTERU|nr:zinc ribbon domain-containing protein [Ktedonosporobacter rubrisoli]QBD78506.1 zinc ribbon domain-containing protein [Ktedonosporobacter rubrisoli]